MIYLFHAAMTLTLFFSVKLLGRYTEFRGYTSLSSPFYDASGSQGYNIVIRALAPPVFICFLSIVLYSLKYSFLINNIWLVTIWYFVFCELLILLLGRFSVFNHLQHLAIAAASVSLSFLVYRYAIIKGPEYILPDKDNIRTEIWIVVIFFFYNVFINHQEDYWHIRRRSLRYVSIKYRQLKERFNSLLEGDYLKDMNLYKSFYSIMIVENFNRPKIYRIFEYFKSLYHKEASTGIMQIKGDHYLSDDESKTGVRCQLTISS